MSFFDRCVCRQYDNRPLYSLDVNQHEQSRMQCEMSVEAVSSDPEHDYCSAAENHISQDTLES